MHQQWLTRTCFCVLTKTNLFKCLVYNYFGKLRVHRTTKRLLDGIGSIKYYGMRAKWCIESRFSDEGVFIVNTLYNIKPCVWHNNFCTRQLNAAIMAIIMLIKKCALQNQCWWCCVILFVVSKFVFYVPCL